MDKEKPSESSVCYICGKTFSCKLYVDSHISQVHAVTFYQCDICSKKFVKKFMLNRHILIHSGQEPFKCQHCPKKFIHFINLKGHLKRHKNIREYECHNCQKSFNIKTALNKHIKHVHNNIRAHTCDVCGTKFHTKVALLRHSIIHSEKKPYECQFCGKRCTQAGNLKIHIMGVHKELSHTLYQKVTPQITPVDPASVVVLNSAKEYINKFQPKSLKISEIKKKEKRTYVRKKIEQTANSFETNSASTPKIMPHRRITKTKELLEVQNITPDVSQKILDLIFEYQKRKYMRQNNNYNNNNVQKLYGVIKFEQNNGEKSPDNTQTNEQLKIATDIDNCLKRKAVVVCKRVDAENNTEPVRVKSEPQDPEDQPDERSSDDILQVHLSPKRETSECGTEVIQDVELASWTEVLDESGVAIYMKQQEDASTNCATNKSNETHDRSTYEAPCVVKKLKVKIPSITTTCKICNKMICFSNKTLAYTSHGDKTCTKCCQVFDSDEDLKKHCEEYCSGNCSKLYNSKKEYLILKSIEQIKNITASRSSVFNSKVFCVNKEIKAADDNYSTNDKSKNHLSNKVSHESNTNKQRINENDSVQNKLSEVKSYFCDFCEYKCNKHENMTDHMMIKHNPVRYQCDQCPKSFSFKYWLVKHKLTHSGEEPFACQICPRKFIDYDLLKSHYYMHTSIKKYKCEVCLKMFKSTRAVGSHVRRVHHGRTFICDQCGGFFKTGKNLKRHMVLHSGEKPFQCQFCKKQCTQASNLKIHILGVHKDVSHLVYKKPEKPVCVDEGLIILPKFGKEYLEKYTYTPNK